MAKSIGEEVTQPLPLDKNVAPSRESRIGAVNAYIGTASEIIRDTKNKNLKIYDRAFSQSWLCSHALGGPTSIPTISDAIGIIHAASGCTLSCLHRSHMPLHHPKGKVETAGAKYTAGLAANWYSTNLTEEDVILGSEKKLRATIKMVEEKHHPKAIFITTSCSAAIIGDDIEGVVKSTQPEVNAVLVPIRCEPFKSRVAQYGLDAFFHAVLKYLVKEPGKKQEDMVNIIARGPEAAKHCDRIYLSQLLARVGIRTNVIPGYCTTEQFQMLAEAAGCAPVCPTATHYLMEGLKQKYGVPYFRNVIPFGVARTEDWLRRIAQFVHKENEMEALILEERAKVMPQIQALREQLQGIKVFVSANQTRTIHLAHMLISDFGMKVVGLNIYEWDDFAAQDLEELLGIAGNTDFLIHIGDAQTGEIINYMKKMDYDLALMHRGPAVPALKLGKPTGRVFTSGNNLRGEHGDDLQMGFRGVVAYGKYISRILRNPSFSQQLSTHVKFPYNQSWYDADASSKFEELE